MDALFSCFGGIDSENGTENRGGSDKIMADGQNGGLCSIIYPEFVEDVDHVAFDRMWTDFKLMRDFHICSPLDHESKYCQFPLG